MKKISTRQLCILDNALVDYASRYWKDEDNNFMDEVENVRTIIYGELSKRKRKNIIRVKERNKIERDILQYIKHRLAEDPFTSSIEEFTNMDTDEIFVYNKEGIKKTIVIRFLN